MLPALQARALTKGRSYVSADDVKVLSTYIFSHRLELAPGAGDVDDIIRDCLAKPIDVLARATLKR